MAEPSVVLPTGAKMPLMAFGTLMENLTPDHQRVVQIVEDAISIGYRHIDTAQIYNTEGMVGEAVRNCIKKGLIKRDDIFITTKLWRNAYKQDEVLPSLKKSIEALGLDYVDLFLVHWPTAFKSGKDLFPKDEQGKFIYADTDPMETWKGMEECYKSGLTKAIGVSNFNSQQIQRILDNSAIKPANNQIESHPFLCNKKLVNYCQGKGITVTAYTPLAGFNQSYRESQGWPTIYSDDKIKSIAEKHNKTPAQIALRYQLERDVAVAPKSAKVERMKQNFEALSFKLLPEDMVIIETCDSGHRLNNEFPDHPHFPFHIEF